MQAATLLPLPKDTPEEVAVVCSGKYGIFHVRSQKILHNGQMMSPSKFEFLCGKGDAKKWKTSLWLVDDHGIQIMVRDPPPLPPFSRVSLLAPPACPVTVTGLLR